METRQITELRKSFRYGRGRGLFYYGAVPPKSKIRARFIREDLEPKERVNGAKCFLGQIPTNPRCVGSSFRLFGGPLLRSFSKHPRAARTEVLPRHHFEAEVEVDSMTV